MDSDILGTLSTVGEKDGAECSVAQDFGNAPWALQVDSFAEALLREVAGQCSWAVEMERKGKRLLALQQFDQLDRALANECSEGAAADDWEVKAARLKAARVAKERLKRGKEERKRNGRDEQPEEWRKRRLPSLEGCLQQMNRGEMGLDEGAQILRQWVEKSPERFEQSRPTIATILLPALAERSAAARNNAAAVMKRMTELGDDINDLGEMVDGIVPALAGHLSDIESCTEPEQALGALANVTGGFSDSRLAERASDIACQEGVCGSARRLVYVKGTVAVFKEASALLCNLALRDDERKQLRSERFLTIIEQGAPLVLKDAVEDERGGSEGVQFALKAIWWLLDTESGEEVMQEVVTDELVRRIAWGCKNGDEDEKHLCCGLAKALWECSPSKGHEQVLENNGLSWANRRCH